MRKLIDSHLEHKHNEHNHKTLIDIKDLSFAYDKKGKQILKDINVSFDGSCFTTIIGANGSGKSTLVKNIVKLVKAKEGMVTLANQDIHLFKGKDYAKRVSYIPQSLEIPYGISVYDFVAFGRIPYLSLFGALNENDKEVVEKVMNKLHIAEWRDKKVEELSGGQRQRVLIAMAIAQETDIIVVDEPTTYLDIKSQYEILELLDELHDEGKTIIAVLHDINQALQYSDEIIAMKDGMIYKKGKPQEIVTDELLKDVFGIKAKTIDDDGQKFILDVKLI